MTKALSAPPRDFDLRAHRVIKFTGNSTQHMDKSEPGGVPFAILAQTGDTITAQSSAFHILAYGYEQTFGSQGLTAPPRDFNLIARST